MRDLRLGEVSNLPKVTHLISGETEIQNLAVWHLSSVHDPNHLTMLFFLLHANLYLF